MKSVHEVTYDLLRARGMTTIFGNPGSNELPFLHNFPCDFQYKLCLHEGVALSMADGYAQASRKPVLVNLHSAAGVGNAMGAMVNASVSHSPIVIVAGQQTRAMITLEAQLTNVSAAELPRPLVKWSFEPPRAQDVPAAIQRAIDFASMPPCGPVLVSVPFDDWDAPAENSGESLHDRSVRWSAAPADNLVNEMAARLERARNPVLIVGAEVDAPGVFESAVELAECCRMAVWIAPSPFRCPFPTVHRCFRGVLPFAIGRLSQELAGHDLILVFGAPVFRYHQYVPGSYLPEGADLIAVTSDPGEAARAPMGQAIVADVGLTLKELSSRAKSSSWALSGTTSRTMPDSRPRAASSSESGAPFRAETLFDIIEQIKTPETIVVNESTGNTEAFWRRVNFDRPGSFFFPAGGSLGFGIPAAIGVKLANASRPVVGVIGDGSANYAITGLWTAARYGIPVVFFILRNEEYAVLKWFAGVLKVGNLPGLDIPGIDYCSIARGYGVKAARVASRDELISVFQKALASQAPHLIEVPIQSIAMPS
jgi:benzoylformate decarboxylase